MKTENIQAKEGISNLLPRKLAFEVLLRLERNSKNLRLKAGALLEETLASSGRNRLSGRDRGFVYALTLAALRDHYRLNAWINLLSGRPLKRVSPSVRVLLRLGLVQLTGVLHVSHYAAVHTTVALARSRKESEKTVGFINAILREAQRRLESGDFPPASGPEEDFSAHVLLAYSWPEALTETVLRQWSRDEVETMAHASRKPAPVSIRVNTLLEMPETYRQRLAEIGLEADAPDPEIPEGFIIREMGERSPAELPGYAEGLFYVQDLSSMWVARQLEPQAGETVLDLCAAPGSKTTHMAALMGNTGRIVAIEPRPERAERLRENLNRLHVGNTEVLQMDALALSEGDLSSAEPSFAQSFDRVLVDAPCSGSGTLRRHPEILLYLSHPNYTEYATHQLALLRKGFDCLKPGGLLVYSTCSIFREENRENIDRLLALYPEACLEGETQRPISDQADGFYVARIGKISKIS